MAFSEPPDYIRVVCIKDSADLATSRINDGSREPEIKKAASTATFD